MFIFQKELSSGVIVSCWELTLISVDISARVARWQVGGWISEEAKQEGKTPVCTEDFVLDGDSYPFDQDNAAEASVLNGFELLSKADDRFK